MYIVGFVTADEAAALAERGYEVEDASNYGLVSPSTAERATSDLRGPHESYLMAKPEPGPDCTQAVAIFVDASVYDVLKADFFTKSLMYDQRNGLDVVAWKARQAKLKMHANRLLEEAENFKYCSHKNPDGSDARYPTGNGETACICGNKWD